MSAKDERAERLAAALRANLRRRKAARDVGAASDDAQEVSASARPGEFEPGADQG